jgi:hypothetical protein
MIEPPLCLSLRVSTTKSLPFNHRIDSDQAEKAFILDFFPEKKMSIMIACLFIRSKSPRPFHALLLRGVPC